MAVGQNFFEGTAIGVLNDILSAFHSNEGYASPNRYEVNLFGPRGRKLGASSQLQNLSVGTESLLNSRDISLRCESVTLPGINLSTIQDTNIYGPTRDIVDGITYAEEVAMSFQASSDLEERVFFERWQKNAFNLQTWNVGYYDDYARDSKIMVTKLSVSGLPVYKHEYLEVYPKTVSSIELSHATASAPNLVNSVNLSVGYTCPAASTITYRL